MANNTDGNDDLPEPPCALVREPLRKQLSEMQIEMYRDARKDLYRWLATKGKDPETETGYAEGTIKDTLHRTAIVQRWMYEDLGLMPTDLTTDTADKYVKKLKKQETSDAHKRKMLDALKRYFRWQGEDWKPETDIRESPSKPKNRKLSKEERRLVKSAALEYGVPTDVDGSAESNREEYVTKLSQHLGKPKDEITEEDWEKVESWKIPSLIYVALDCALRPKEVKNLTMDQIDWRREYLVFEEDDTTKNDEPWENPLSSDTMTLLRKWRDERNSLEKYDETDIVWLTREANPYRSDSLCDLLHRLLRMRGIEPDDDSRKLTWYSIRHSCGDRLVGEHDYEMARQILRHKWMDTTRKYNIKSDEEKEAAIEELD